MVKFYINLKGLLSRDESRKRLIQYKLAEIYISSLSNSLKSYGDLIIAHNTRSTCSSYVVWQWLKRVLKPPIELFSPSREIHWDSSSMRSFSSATSFGLVFKTSLLSAPKENSPLETCQKNEKIILLFSSYRSIDVEKLKLSNLLHWATPCDRPIKFIHSTSRTFWDCI